MMAMRRWLPVLVILSGCEISSSEPLPDAYFQESTRAFTVRAGQTLRDADDQPLPVRSLGGFDGAPGVPGGMPVDEFFQRSGVKAVRFPRGWGCEFTLDTVFPSVLADPESNASYRLDPLEQLARSFVSRGMLPIWQAQYDVGGGACRLDGTLGRGDPIGDPVLWGQVVNGVLAQMNRKIGAYYNTEYRERLAQLRQRPGYVELLPDPMGASGYAMLGIDYLLPAYTAFFDALEVADMEATTERVLDVAAPSFRVEGAGALADQDSPMRRFLAFVAQRSGSGPDLWSLLSTVRTPEDHVALIQGLLDRVDLQGLSNHRVADLGMRVAPDVWQERAADLATPAERSAYLGAFLAMVKILGQNRLELLVPDRWGGPRASADAQAGEDLFLDAAGNGLPAFHSLTPFFLMELGKAVHVPVDAADGVSGARDVRVLAGRDPDGNVGIIVAALPLPDDARVGYRVTVRLEVTGLGSGAWTMRRAVIDQVTTGFGYTESARAVPAEGVLIVSRQVVAPSVQYFELKPEP